MFTANPQQPEIIENLLCGQQAIDCPDLIARVFALKIKELLIDLKNHLFRLYAGYIYTIEYQKRGLLYMHLLLFLKRGATFLTPELINKVVCAKLPDLLQDPIGEPINIIIWNITYSLCRLDNYPKAPCIGYKTLISLLACQKRFLKAFAAIIVVYKDRYPEYYYQNNSCIFIVCKLGFLDQEVVRNNYQVIPYNLYILQKFCSHINIKVCIIVKAIKYIHKYVYKGTDRIIVVVSGTNNKITCYVQAQYIGPIEAFWRLFEYTTHQEFLLVQHLAVYLPGQHIVYFTNDISPKQVAAKAANARSTLIAFFEYNTIHNNSY